MILPLILAATLAAPPAISILVRAPDGTLAEPTAPLQGGNFSGPGAPPYEGRLRYGNRHGGSWSGYGRSYGYGHAPPQHPGGFGFGTSRTPPHAGAGHRGGPARVR